MVKWHHKLQQQFSGDYQMSRIKLLYAKHVHLSLTSAIFPAFREIFKYQRGYHNILSFPLSEKQNDQIQ